MDGGLLGRRQIRHHVEIAPDNFLDIDSGLRHGHGYLIQRLVVAPATATAIAAELGVTQQAVSKSVKELIALGLVEFVPDPPDRRTRPVRLTATGWQAVHVSRTTRLEIDQRIRTALGDHNFECTLAALSTAIDALGLTERVRRRAVLPPRPTFD